MSTRSLDRWELAAFAVLAALIALAFNTTLGVQFTLPKLFWLHIALAVLAAFWTVRIRRGHAGGVPPVIVGCSVALVIWWVITTATAIHLHTALVGAYGRYNGLITHIVWLCLFVIGASGGLGRQQIDRRVRAIVAGCIPVAAYAVAQYVGWDVFVWPNVRPASTIGQPVPLAALLGLCVPFALAWAISFSGVRRAAAGAVLALMLIGMSVTLSRGPAAGALLAGAIVAIAALREHRVTVRTLLVSGVAAAATSVAILMISVGGWSRFLERINPLRDSSFMDRFAYYRIALAMARDRPFFGSGFESYGLQYPQYFLPSTSGVGSDLVPTMVHNGYLQMIVTNGLPALALYLLLVASVLWLVVRAYRRLSTTQERLMCVAFFAAIVGYLIQDLTGWLEVSLSAFFWIILGLAVAYCAAGAEGDRRPQLRQRSSIAFAAPSAAAAVAIAGVALAIATSRTLEADALMFESFNADVSRDWPATTQRMERALRLAPNEARYWDDAALVYIKRVNVASDAAAYASASRLLATAHRLNPYDSYALMHRIELDIVAARRGVIRATSQEAEAAVRTLAAVDRSHSIAYSAVARLRLTERRFDDALAAVTRAKAMNPQRTGYDELEGDIWRERGNRDAAVAAYRREMARLQRQDGELLQTGRKLVLNLIESGRYREAESEAQSLLQKNPRDAITNTLLDVARRH